MRKIYGDTPTALSLSKKAEAAYIDINPIEIEEIYQDCDDAGSAVYNYTVRIDGSAPMRGMSAQKVNDFLEEWYDAVMTADEDEDEDEE